MGFCGYRFLQAHRFAVQKGLAKKGVARVMTPCLIVRAETLLRNNQWSPQQICDALNHEDGAKLRGAIASMVERKTKPTILVLLDGPTSEVIKDGIIRRLTPHKKHVLALT